MPRPEILVLNGPNMNMLGIRNPHLFDGLKIGQLELGIRKHAETLGYALTFEQSNHEGRLVDLVHEGFVRDIAGLIINPTAFTQTGLALADALGMLKCPVIEVHFANVHRDPLKSARIPSLLRPSVTAFMGGLGPTGYLVALDAIHRLRNPYDFLAP